MSVVTSTGQESATLEERELRCPHGPKQLLAKVRANGDYRQITNDNVLEIACRDCARVARQKDPTVRRVLHRFNILGELVESVIQRSEDLT